MLTKKYEVVFKYNMEDTIVPASGGRKTILRINGRAGKLQQVSYRTTQYDTRLIIRVDNEYEIDFPTTRTIAVSHTFFRPYAPEAVWNSKTVSPYAITSTIVIEFEKSIEVIILNEASAASTLTENFLIAKLFTGEYEKVTAWDD